MSRWTSRALAAAALAAAALPAAVTTASAQEKGEKTLPPDEVIRVEGGKVVAHGVAGGVIESADFDQVVYVAPAGGKLGGKRTVPASDVIELRFGDAPEDWDPGLRALAAKDGETARRAFRDCIAAKDAKPSLRAWITEFANARLGEACVLLAAKDPKAADEAVKAFEAARAANAKSILTDRILAGAAEAEMLRGQTDAAVRAGDALVAAGKAAKRTSWEMDGHLLRARAQQQAGNFAGAATAFEDAARFAETALQSEKNEAAKTRLRQLAFDAATRRGWALVAKGEASKSAADLDAARAYFDGLAQKHPTEPSVMAAASNAAGISKLAGGDAKGALRQFQRTEVLWFQSADEVARSLWYQAHCAKKIGDDKLAADRVRDLQEFVPGSEWARRAP
jgi:hypothetical protein